MGTLSEDTIIDNDRELSNEAEKVERLFQVMGMEQTMIASVNTFEMTRIGQPNSSMARLLKINLNAKTTRDAVLEKAKQLKDKNDPWKKVYVKKDVHLVYAKENQRLNN